LSATLGVNVSFVGSLDIRCDISVLVNDRLQVAHSAYPSSRFILLVTSIDRSTLLNRCWVQRVVVDISSDHFGQSSREQNRFQDDCR
jgi:hypothetical protein